MVTSVEPRCGPDLLHARLRTTCCWPCSRRIGSCCAGCGRRALRTLRPRTRQPQELRCRRWRQTGQGVREGDAWRSNQPSLHEVTVHNGVYADRCERRRAPPSPPRGHGVEERWSDLPPMAVPLLPGHGSGRYSPAIERQRSAPQVRVRRCDRDEFRDDHRFVESFTHPATERLKHHVMKEAQFHIHRHHGQMRGHIRPIPPG